MKIRVKIGAQESSASVETPPAKAERRVVSPWTGGVSYSPIGGDAPGTKVIGVATAVRWSGDLGALLIIAPTTEVLSAAIARGFRGFETNACLYRDVAVVRPQILDELVGKSGEGA